MHINQNSLSILSSATLHRRSLIQKLGIGIAAGVAAGGVSSVAAQTMSTPMAEATPSNQMAPFASTVDVLNYALTLEHLETAFYRDGLAMMDAQAFVDAGYQESVFTRLMEIGEHEAAHVTTLTDVITQLGGEPVAEATYDFGYTDVPSFLQVAQALEDTGVSAYQGAAQYAMDDDDLLTAALTIHGVEARHAAYLALLNGGNPFPEAVNPTLTPDEVLEIATPFIVQ